MRGLALRCLCAGRWRGFRAAIGAGAWAVRGAALARLARRAFGGGTCPRPWPMGGRGRAAPRSSWAPSDGTAKAGHLGEGDVRPTLEVIVTENPAHLRKNRGYRDRPRAHPRAARDVRVSIGCSERSKFHPSSASTDADFCRN
jgi:hypothetical protein